LDEYVVMTNHIYGIIIENTMICDMSMKSVESIRFAVKMQDLASLQSH
jgi:hypothetical protein